MHGLRVGKVFLLVISMGYMLTCVSISAAATQQVEAEGIAAIRKGNVGIAKDQSLEDALRKAVEQAVGTLIEAESVVENFKLLHDEIYTRTQGYVKHYTPVSEKREGDLLRVMIRATVDVGTLEQDLKALGLLYRRVKKPRIMVVIEEAYAGARPGNPAGETEIIRQLLEHGIKVVDQKQARRISESDQRRKALAGDNKAAQLIGLRHGAEVLILGQAFGELAMRGKQFGGLVSVRARLEARAIRADTGEILAADGQFAPGVDVEEQLAVKKALVEVARVWVDANLPIILDKWQLETTETTPMQLVINGLTLPQLVQFEGMLREEVRGVRDIQRRSLDNGVAILDVDLKGTGQALADALAQQKFDRFEVKVLRFSSHLLDLQVRQK